MSLDHPSRERLFAPWLHDSETRILMEALEKNGARARFVGGCVRNALMNIPASDIDIAIDVPPEETMRLLEKAGIKAVPTGIDHGTVTAVFADHSFEITTLRKDVKTNGRHAEVSFDANWEEDAKRRDFTINALYADPDGTLYDPIHGLSDIRAQRVRFIGSAQKRIEEDYLRILRFFRFHAWYGSGEMEPDGLVACAGLAHGLTKIAKERIGAEILKMLAAPEPAQAVESAIATGVLAAVLPDLTDAGSIPERLRALIAVEHRIGMKPDPIRRLAVVARTASPARVAGSLRLSRSNTRALELLMGWTEPVLDLPGARRLGYRCGDVIGRDALAILASEESRISPARLLAGVKEGAGMKLPLAANDLIMRGLSPGPAMGDALRAAEDIWIESDFVLDKHTLIAEAMRHRAAG